MALEQRIESLRKRHAELEAKLLAEKSHPAHDDGLLHRLKCEKLNLKDEMVRLLSTEGQRYAA